MKKSKLVVGDSVWTVNMMFFVEGRHPQTGEEIETYFPERHHLKVCGVNEAEDTVDVLLPKGYVATLDRDAVDGVTD